MGSHMMEDTLAAAGFGSLLEERRGAVEGFGTLEAVQGMLAVEDLGKQAVGDLGKKAVGGTALVGKVEMMLA